MGLDRQNFVRLWAINKEVRSWGRKDAQRDTQIHSRFVSCVGSKVFYITITLIPFRRILTLVDSIDLAFTHSSVCDLLKLIWSPDLESTSRDCSGIWRRSDGAFNTNKESIVDNWTNRSEECFLIRKREPNPSFQVSFHGDDENVFVTITMEAQAGNHLKHWLKITCTAQGDDEAGIVLSATYTEKAVKLNVTNKNGNREVQTWEVKTTIDRALMESQRRRDSHITEMSEKTVILAIKTFVVESQHGAVRYRVSLSFWSETGNIFDKGGVTGHMQKAAIKAVVHFAKTKPLPTPSSRSMISWPQRRHLWRNRWKKSRIASQRKKTFLRPRGKSVTYFLVSNIKRVWWWRHAVQRKEKKTLFSWQEELNIVHLQALFTM